MARDSLAIDTLQISVQDIVGDRLELAGIKTQLGFNQSGVLELQLEAETAKFPGIDDKLSAVSLACKEFKPLPELICRSGQLSLVTPSGQVLRVAIDIHYQPAHEQLAVQLGQLDEYWRKLTVSWQSSELDNITISGEAIDLSVYALLNDFVELPELLIGKGEADLDVELKLKQGEVGDIAVSGTITNASLSNLDTTQAMEDVSGKLNVTANQVQGHWQGDISIDLSRGFLYSDPVGIDASSFPLQVSTEFFQETSAETFLSNLHWRQPGVADLITDVRFSTQTRFELHSLKVNAESLLLEQLYPAYVQPWLYELDIPELKLSGSLSGGLIWQSNSIDLSLKLNDVAIQESTNQFGINGVSGMLHWGNQGEQLDSQLRWLSANFYNLPFGESQLKFSSEGNEFSLSEPLSIPFLDGAIQIDGGYMQNPGEDDMAWSFDAYLKPVSMLKVTEALGWQAFGGKLSGMIPELRYQDKRLQLDGTLLVSAFDGSITVNNLLIDEPFGLVPRMQADIVMDNLDLEAVTGTFSFGKIEGRLDGYINDLDMLAWQPVRFDALLITPSDDKSRHRISQRAVDNLTRIGGGVGGALSRGFLRFFEDFSYDQLGLGCRLQNGVCQMRGAQPAAQGYYIVKGGLIPPRIDIVGYADQVDWRQLVNQLVEVTRSEAVTVE